jgi:serine/threonine-protein kinase HipA
MAKPAQDSLEVWLDDRAFGNICPIGTLHRGDKGSVRFVYTSQWRMHPTVFALDPELALEEGSHYPVDSNFGIFLDSSPDRWGQVLMKRRELIDAREEKRTRRELTAWDFLKGVQDFTRMGALRFREPDSQAFVADEARAAPPLAHLAQLQAVAFELTKKKADDDLEKLRQWLSVLVAPGASLGGARPKANLLGDGGSLWIAKFPSADDDNDVALWEKFTHDLARRCGIRVPESRLERVGHGYHTFVVKRFDREGGNRRFFTSAMTLLKKSDKEHASYLDMAEFIATKGSEARVSEDLHELFRRVVFNVAVGNRDDHLRNHGFMRHPAGWRLADAYDMNSSTKKPEHVLALDYESNEPHLSTVLATAKYYRLSESQGLRIVRVVLDVLATWRIAAKAAGISSIDIAALETIIVDRFDA